MMHTMNGPAPMRAFTCLISLMILIPAATGCTRFPALDDTVTAQNARAPYPALVPIAPLLEETAGSTRAERDTQEQKLQARGAALRARAAALQADSP